MLKGLSCGAGRVTGARGNTPGTEIHLLCLTQRELKEPSLGLGDRMGLNFWCRETTQAGFVPGDLSQETSVPGGASDGGLVRLIKDFHPNKSC
jgi:hypothetical protein